MGGRYGHRSGSNDNDGQMYAIFRIHVVVWVSREIHLYDFSDICGGLGESRVAYV